MKRGDVIWGLLLVFTVMLFLISSTREIILNFSSTHHYVSGFIKFAILATMGDVLGKRIVSGDYLLSSKTIWSALVWGIIGCMVTLVFPVFMGGAQSAQAGHLLPFYEVPAAQAIFGSSVMNLTFAPVMNTFHRLTDLWIESSYNAEKVTFKGLINKIDWGTFVIFNWIKVGIFFWIPVHSIIFLLPENLRVAVAAFSSIILGVILSFAAKKAADS